MIPPPWKLHAIAIHFPMALLVVALLLELIGIISRRREFNRMAVILLVIGAAGTIPAFFTGHAAEETVWRTSEEMEAVLERHELLGLVTMIVSLAFAAIRVLVEVGGTAMVKLGLATEEGTRRNWLGFSALALGWMLTVGVLLAAGHQGGRLVYDFGANVQPYQQIMQAPPTTMHQPRPQPTGEDSAAEPSSGEHHGESHVSASPVESD